MTRTTESSRSGTLTLEGGEIVFTIFSAAESSWRAPVAEIAVIGALTTAGGPVADDYFLAFVLRDGTVYLGSFYAAGSDRTLAALSALLRTELRPGLANSAEWRSLVMWPAQLAGQSLFQLGSSVSTGMLHRLKRALGLTETEAVLTQQVLEYLADGGENTLA
jgi:hypothetical protein